MVAQQLLVSFDVVNEKADCLFFLMAIGWRLGVNLNENR